MRQEVMRCRDLQRIGDDVLHVDRFVDDLVDE